MTTDRPMKRRRLEDDLRDSLGDRSEKESEKEVSETPEDSGTRNEPSEPLFDPAVSVINSHEDGPKPPQGRIAITNTNPERTVSEQVHVTTSY